MQTFLPVPSFDDSARLLDYRRLGKQRVEAKQIYDCLTGSGSLRWGNHPAVKMWKGHEESLGAYHDSMIAEWVRRGYKNTMPLLNTSGEPPEWFGDELFHSSHRSNLLRKDLTFYSAYGWSEGVDLPYIWPSNNA